MRQREGHPVARMVSPVVINVEARGYEKAGGRFSLPVSWSAPASAGWVNKICD